MKAHKENNVYLVEPKVLDTRVSWSKYLNTIALSRHTSPYTSPKGTIYLCMRCTWLSTNSVVKLFGGIRWSEQPLSHPAHEVKWHGTKTQNAWESSDISRPWKEKRLKSLWSLQLTISDRNHKNLFLRQPLLHIFPGCFVRSRSAFRVKFNPTKINFGVCADLQSTWHIDGITAPVIPDERLTVSNKPPHLCLECLLYNFQSCLHVYMPTHWKVIQIVKYTNHFGNETQSISTLSPLQCVARKKKLNAV